MRKSNGENTLKHEIFCTSMGQTSSSEQKKANSERMDEKGKMEEGCTKA